MLIYILFINRGCRLLIIIYFVKLICILILFCRENLGFARLDLFFWSRYLRFVFWNGVILWLPFTVSYLFFTLFIQYLQFDLILCFYLFFKSWKKSKILDKIITFFYCISHKAFKIWKREPLTYSYSYFHLVPHQNFEATCAGPLHQLRWWIRRYYRQNCKWNRTCLAWLVVACWSFARSIGSYYQDHSTKELTNQ